MQVQSTSTDRVLIIELCCGLGRFERPGADIISIDIDRKVKPTILADIRHLPLRPDLRPDLLHASPPCTYISKARRWGIGWNPLGIAETFRLYAACYEAAYYLNAKNFTLEQPRGLEDLLGTKVQFKYDKTDLKNCTTNFYSNNKGLKRALIPYDVRQTLLAALLTEGETS